MMIILDHIHTTVFPWVIRDGVSIRGQVEYQGKIYRGQALAELIAPIASAVDEDSFMSLVNALKGNFSIIAERSDGSVWLAVDIASSLPLFYHRTDMLVSDEAELIRQKAGIEPADISPRNLGEQLLLCYSMFDHTAYAEIAQVDIGQCVFLSRGRCRKVFYYTHLQPIIPETYAQAYDRYREANRRMADRMIQMLDGRQAVISLSGGYDSRYIIGILTEAGYENVVCYTIGKKDSYEMEFAQDICRKTGYPWYGFENTPEIAREQGSGYLDEYLLHANHHSALPHLSFYYAVRHLHEQGLIEPDAVFITGFCGDLPAGSFVFSPEDRQSLNYSTEFLAKLFYYDEYFNYDCASSVDEQYIDEIKQYITEKYDLQPIDFQSFVQLHDALFTVSRPGKFVVNANRCFELCGHEWLLPLWDRDFLDYWYSVPYEYREKQKLYRDFLNRELFARWGIDFLKSFDHVQPWYFRRNRLKTRIKHTLGSWYYRMSFAGGHPVKRKLDWDNQAEIMFAFYQRLQNKKAVNFRRPNINTIMHLWLCEQLYGSDEIRQAQEFLNGTRS